MVRRGPEIFHCFHRMALKFHNEVSPTGTEHGKLATD